MTPVNVASALFFESALEIFRRVYREIKPHAALPSMEVEFCAFANANSQVRLENGCILVRVTDLLENAPAPVIEALAHILLGKLFRRRAAAQYEHRYRLYLNRRDIRARIDSIRQERGRKVHRGSRGLHHDLEDVFENLNRLHFGGLMARPALGWSHIRSRSRLGHYDPSHHMIIISRIFDDVRVPRIALDYVMFHEMLHLRYPVEHSGSRRCVHTPDFKAHEKQFPHYAEAKALLKKLPG